MRKIRTLISFILLMVFLLSLSISAAGISAPGYVAKSDNSGIKMVAPAGTTFKIENGVFVTTSGANRPSFEVKDLAYENIVVKEYPIIAMKIKLEKADSVFGSFDVATDDSLNVKNLGAPIKSYPINIKATYQATTDWQLVTGDISSFYNEYSTVDGIDYYWIDNDSKYKFNVVNTMGALIPGVNVTFYIEWIGYFKTVADAQAYYNSSTGESETTTATTTVATTSAGTTSTTSPETSDMIVVQLPLLSGAIAIVYMAVRAYRKRRMPI